MSGGSNAKEILLVRAICGQKKTKQFFLKNSCLTYYFFDACKKSYSENPKAHWLNSLMLWRANPKKSISVEQIKQANANDVETTAAKMAQRQRALAKAVAGGNMEALKDKDAKEKEKKEREKELEQTVTPQDLAEKTKSKTSIEEIKRFVENHPDMF